MWDFKKPGQDCAFKLPWMLIFPCILGEFNALIYLYEYPYIVLIACRSS